ncbi:MAG: glycosyltransferase family 4 protein [Thiobacillus sp.]
MSKKLKIFIDAEVLVTPHFSGIGHYTLELLRGLDHALDSRDDIKVVLLVYFRNYSKIKKYGFKNITYRKSPFPMRVNNYLKIHNLQFFYDLFFGRAIYLFPNYTSWPLLFSKSVPIIYDLSFEYHPHYVEPNNQRFLSSGVRKSVERSNRIVTISTNSKNEIIEFYKVPGQKVDIIYPGVDQTELFRWPENEIAKVKARYGVFGKYILFVGNIEPRKNLKNLLLAYEKLDKKTRKKYSILLVGARGWLDDEIFEIIERLRLDGNLIQQPTQHVEDKDRAALYSGASLFVYPSRYEGFGIPPLEAMACGVPAITSDNSSLPEAVGDAAIKVSAESVDDLTNAMNNVLKDETLRDQLIDKGYKQIHKYSWDREAEKLIETFKKVKSVK